MSPFGMYWRLEWSCKLLDGNFLICEQTFRGADCSVSSSSHRRQILVIFRYNPHSSIKLHCIEAGLQDGRRCWSRRLLEHRRGGPGEDGLKNWNSINLVNVRMHSWRGNACTEEALKPNTSSKVSSFVVLSLDVSINPPRPAAKIFGFVSIRLSDSPADDNIVFIRERQ
jgi:hypothetical protein